MNCYAGSNRNVLRKGTNGIWQVTPYEVIQNSQCGSGISSGARRAPVRDPYSPYSPPYRPPSPVISLHIPPIANTGSPMGLLPLLWTPTFFLPYTKMFMPWTKVTSHINANDKTPIGPNMNSTKPPCFVLPCSAVGLDHEDPVQPHPTHPCRAPSLTDFPLGHIRILRYDGVLGV